MSGKKKLLIATTNLGKLNELRALLGDLPFSIVSMSEVGLTKDVEETGNSLEENARLKALTYSRLSGLLTVSDDSGLEVDALGGEPGHKSARYAGKDANDKDRLAFLLSKLRDVPEELWMARFRCVIALAEPSGRVELFEGVCNGRLVQDSRGNNGFGYDPIFLIPQLNKTMAELTTEEKNRLSHRAIAVRSAAVQIKQRAAIKH